MRSSQKRPEPAVEFFIDRSLGRRRLREALVALGFNAHTMWSVYGQDQEQGVDDRIWLEHGATNGWILLTKDRRIRYVSVERDVIERCRGRVFCLGPKKLAGPDQVACFVRNIGRIVRRSRRAGPFIDRVYADRVERWWP